MRRPCEDLDGLGNRRLVDDDLLQPARQRAILLDVLELLVRRRADQPQLAGGQDRLDERREIHRAARRRASADRRVNLVDEEDRHRALRERVDDSLEALLEVAAEARAGEERAGVEREDFGALEQIRDVVSEETRREAFGQRRLADAGVADEDRDCSCGGGTGSPSSAASSSVRPIRGSSSPALARAVRSVA